MQCFICVTYMIILCSGNPTKLQDIDDKYEKISFVNNFIASLFNNNINKQTSDNINDNEENTLAHNYEYDNFRLHLNEADILPRRNDRIALPPLQYRFPKSIKNASSENNVIDTAKKEIVKFHNVNESQNIEALRIQRSRHGNKSKTNRTEDIEATPEILPFSTTIAGQSQIGNRESQTVVKPTVIVNIRGSISNRDDTRLDKGRDVANDTEITRNVFNINQEINMNSNVSHGKRGNAFQQDIKDEQETKSSVDLMAIICQPTYWKEKKNKNRKLDVMQILLSV